MPSHLLLGALAGLSIFFGFPVARWVKATEHLRGILALLSIGIFIFLIIETGYQAIERLEIIAKNDTADTVWLLGCIFIIGLAVGLLALALLEATQSQKNRKTEQAKPKKNAPVSSFAIINPLKIVTLAAVAIGLHNFAEGLVIGQIYSKGAMGLNTPLMIGFALYGATKGIAIYAPLAGYSITSRALLCLGLIAGGPALLGAYLGGMWFSPAIEILFLSVALGSLVCVIWELLPLRLASINTIAGLSILMLGLVFSFGTKLFVNVAQADYTAQVSKAAMADTVHLSFLQGRQAFPKHLSIKRGQALVIENQNPQTLIFEGNGLFVGEVAVSAKDQIPVLITGRVGEYRLMDEYNRSAIVLIIVQAGKEMDVLSDEVNAVAALTLLEGHVRISRVLHQRASLEYGPDPALDLKRAEKHAGHPQHELLMGSEPDALMLQSLLHKYNQYDALDQALKSYVKFSGDKEASETGIEQRYQVVLNSVEQARRSIAGSAYDTSDFRRRVAQIVMDTAASEYATATESGQIEVKEPGVPGKDNYFEYQDALGFLWASHSLLFPNGKSFDFAPVSVDEKLGQLIEGTFKRLDPPDPKHPVPANQVKKLIGAIEEDLIPTSQVNF